MLSEMRQTHDRSLLAKKTSSSDVPGKTIPSEQKIPQLFAEQMGLLFEPMPTFSILDLQAMPPEEKEMSLS